MPRRIIVREHSRQILPTQYTVIAADTDGRITLRVEVPDERHTSNFELSVTTARELIDALTWAAAGPLGRAAIDAERQE